MRIINNRSELNNYYYVVSTGLEKYLREYKVIPRELKTYIEHNLEEIKEELGVSDVVGIDKVIFDVVNHYNNTHLDKILKFESFTRFRT